MSEVIDERIRYLEWRVKNYINVLEKNMRSSKNQETKVRYKSQIRLLRSTLEDIAFVKSKDPAELRRLRESWEEDHNSLGIEISIKTGKEIHDFIETHPGYECALRTRWIKFQEGS